MAYNTFAVRFSAQKPASGKLMGLWGSQELRVIGIAGEPNSGKTLWGLSVDPNCLNRSIPPTTLIWDTEGSSETYSRLLNFERRDVISMACKFRKDYGPIDIFTVWLDDMLKLPAGRFKVLIIDTIPIIETGLALFVDGHPNQFGYTVNQFAASKGLFWGAVKHEWKRILLQIAQKCETLVLTMHMKSEFRGARPTGKRIPMGKETVMEICSLYMTLVRRILPGQASVSPKPSGKCDHPYGKSRLMYVNDLGEMQQLLPPFLPDASPAGIRYYIDHPADFTNLKPQEQAMPDEELSEDERLVLRASIAADESAKAQAELAKAEMAEPKQPPEDDLKVKLLGAMTLPEARELLSNRFAVSKVSELNDNQRKELEEHLNSLGN